MGLMLRYNLFYQVQAKNVYGAYREFYGNRRRTILFEGRERDAISIYHPQNEWTVVNLGSGWEWKERREAQLLVSNRLYCPGFLVFVYDGIYWGYEFFANGVVLDHFVQDPDESEHWFSGTSCKGDPDVLVTHLPHLERDVFAAYLAQKFGRNEKVRPEDKFEGFHSCVLNFLNYLGVPVVCRDYVVGIDSTISQRFWLGQYAT